MRCAFCNATALDVEEAVNAGWEATYWVIDVEEEEVSGPVCPHCQKRHCERDGFGNLVLRHGHRNPRALARERADLMYRLQTSLSRMPVERLRTIALLIGA